MTDLPTTLADLRTRIIGFFGQLRALADPGGPSRALLAGMAKAEDDGSIAAFIDSARVLSSSLEELQTDLREVLTQADKIEQVGQRRDGRDSEVYWRGLTETLHQAAMGSADELRSAWLRSFAHALAAWRLDACEHLTREVFRDADGLDEMRRTFSAAVAALRSDERAGALPGIELLVQEHPAGLPKSPLNETSRAAALLVLGRIRLSDTADKAASLTCFERAREAVPQDGRVLAALAEYNRATGNDTMARDLSRRAIALSPDRPDGYVSMALSCEGQAWWDEATDWYAQAVKAVLRRADSGNALGELGQLLAPVSGALYLRLGEAIRRTSPLAALAAAEKAIELGIKGEGKYPQRAAFRLKGELLEELQRSAEAAESLSQAAQYSALDDDAETAFYLHRRVSELDPKRVSNYWRWADALLMASYLSKPPYVDKDKISQSLEVWRLGAENALPDDDHKWAYLTRARIAKQMANLPGADRWQQHWETVAFVEQSLLLDPVRALAWVTMGQAHHALGNDLNALHATETALLCDSEDIGAIEQRIIFLVNLERYAEAQPLLSKRRAMSPSATAWINALEAHIVVQQFPAAAGRKDCEAALGALDASPDWQTPWSSVDRARLLHAIGRNTEAKDEYKKLWGRVDELDVDNQVSYAWAAMMTGDVNDLNVALRLFSAHSRDRVSGRTFIERYLGFGRLLLGENELARVHFDRAIEIAGTARELDAWLGRDVEAEEVFEKLVGQPQAGTVREMLDLYRAAALKRRAALPLLGKPEQELQRLAAELQPNSEKEGWGWISLQAAAARFDLEASRWREAEETYQTLERYPGRFYTAHLGREQAQYGLAVERGSSRPDTLSGHRTRLARIHTQRVSLERQRRPLRIFGQAGMQRIPAVTPIAIEAAANLGELLEGRDGKLEPQFAQLLQNLRQGLYDRSGFTMPVVRVRASDLPDGTYVIILNEVPVASGNLDLTRGLCNETVDRLVSQGITADEAVNPVNGSECAWVGQDDWQRVKDAGLHIWAPAEYILLHLSAVVRKNAAELVGLQRVVDLLRIKAEDRYSAIVSAKDGLPRFTSVLQALLAEEVPIKELSSICDCYLGNLNLPTHDIPEQIRNLEAIRKDLVGNSSDAPIWLLGQNLVSLINRGIVRDGEAAVLAIEPEPTQDALTAVRNEMTSMSPTARNPVLVVEDWQIRAFVRKLVELEFPHLAVLSRREALAADARPVLATIEIETRGRPGRR